ncbi:hypothetical protein ACFS07_32440 [Undibacterium arcticum]
MPLARRVRPPSSNCPLNWNSAITRRTVSWLRLKKLAHEPAGTGSKKVVAALDLKGVANKIEIAGPGFINIHLDSAFLARRNETALKDEHLGVTLPPPLKLMVEYSSPPTWPRKCMWGTCVPLSSATRWRECWNFLVMMSCAQTTSATGVPNSAC